MGSLAAAAFALALLAPAENPDGRGIGRAVAAARPAAAVARLAAVDIAGRTWRAADLRGRVTLIDFWATWCAPCLADLPRLQDLRAQHPRDDFEILGISLDVRDRRSFVSWLNRNRVDWPQVHERSGYDSGVPALFGVDAIPRTILLDRDGTVAAVDLRGDALVRAVNHLVRTSRVPDGVVTTAGDRGR